MQERKDHRRLGMHVTFLKVVRPRTLELRGMPSYGWPGLPVVVLVDKVEGGPI